MSESIGAQLRQARELRRLTLQQVSEATKLRTYYLQALENDDYSAIPSAAQARGFLRLYVEFIQLDLADLVPPATPIEAAPVAASTPMPPARPSLWTSLRERLARRAAKPEAAQEMPASEPSVEPAPEAPSSAAAAEAQTTRRSKPASTDVKKNAVK